MQFIKQLFVLSLSILVILFSGGAQVASHFCNGKVVSKSFNLEVEKCRKDNVVVPFTKHPIASKSSCCDTEVSFLKSSVSEKFDFQKEITLIKPTIAFVQVSKEPVHAVKSIKKLRPPPSGPSIHVWHDQFLI
jgi:hypothetical protein